MRFTEEQQSAIIDIAERYLARRARAAKTGASVTRNNWTKQEAIINGARNDLRSATFAFEQAKARYEVAKAEYELRLAGVEARTKRLQELEAE